jgi:hypothetical protein
VTTAKRAEANRRNALRSTGPKTPEGIEKAKLNALHHGLRSLEVVAPGEPPEAWEIHRAAVLEDLAPAGAVEAALAEQVAAKLWRLGRVARHEVDLITNGQDTDEVLHVHEKTHPAGFRKTKRTDIPARETVDEARKTVRKAQEILRDLEAAIRVLEGLKDRADKDKLSDEEWAVYEPLLEALGLNNEEDSPFKGDEDFVVGHVRTLLQKRGSLNDVTEQVLGSWRTEKLEELRETVDEARKAYRGLHRRYEAALERCRRGRGLPSAADLEKVQRYEAHLERGFHKALDRLRDLQEARGAAPPRPPAVAVALVQTASGAAADELVGSFGNSTPTILTGWGDMGPVPKG